MKEKNVSKLYAYMILIVSMTIIGICIVEKIPLFYGFLGSVIFSIMILTINGFKLVDLVKMALRGIKECFAIYIIVLLMGAIIAIWIASGTVPTMMYYGFDYIVNINYVLACFFVSAMVAFFMGTAFGTISTIGVALLGIGKGLDIPIPILLGAIISGAFIADKMSPISVLVNITLQTTNVKYGDFFKKIMVTLIPTLAISSIIYYIIGKNYESEIDILKLKKFQENIEQSFFVSPALLLIPVAIIILAVIGVKIIPNMSIGLLAGMGISYFLQGLKINEIIEVVFVGYKASTGIIELDGILKGGGIVPMVEVVLMIMGAVALSSIFEGTNIIHIIIENMIKKIKTESELIFKTSMLSIVGMVVTCDQTVGILLPGKFLKSKYEEFKIENIILARTIADTGTTVAPLIPWNVNALIIMVISGISVTEYGVYAVLCYISPIITMTVGLLKKDRVEIYKKVYKVDKKI